MLEGDSITHGFHGDYTWRYRLDKELQRQGVAADLVGSRDFVQTTGGFSAASYANSDFDRDHFAKSGSTLRQHAEWIGAEVTAQDPDIVVLAAGINDLRNGADPEDVNRRLRDWIEAARTAKPTLRIVVSPILEALGPRPYLGEYARQYNAKAAETVAELTTEESPITLADTTRGWNVAAHTGDNLHPNPTGETLIAQRIAEHLHALGILPSQPNIYRATAWTPAMRVAAALIHGRAVISWDKQAITFAKVSIRRAGRGTYVGTSYGGALTTGVLERGVTYEFRVQYWRGRTATPWSHPMRLVSPGVPRPAAVAKVTVTMSGISWTRSATARSYLVKFRKAGGKRWITRRTTGLNLAVHKAARAKVWAVNAGGRSSVRFGAR